MTDDPYPECDSTRHGRHGVMRCPHGCVTECARERKLKEEALRLAELAGQLAMDESLYGFSVIDGETGERVDPRSIKPMDRYGLYGLIPREREVNEPMDYEQQNIGDKGETLIYETSDPAEARAIYEAGGYTDGNGVWHVVTRVEDRMKTSTPTTHVPSKEEFQ